MTDEYMIKENGFFFTDINAPSIEIQSYGDLSPPGNPPVSFPDAGNTTTSNTGTVTQYEDADVIFDHFTYDGSGKLVSFLETTKATNNMVLYTFTRTAGPALEPIGTNEDYQNFSMTGQVDSIGSDVPNSSIENYQVIETPIAYISIASTNTAFTISASSLASVNTNGSTIELTPNTAWSQADYDLLIDIVPSTTVSYYANTGANGAVISVSAIVASTNAVVGTNLSSVILINTTGITDVTSGAPFGNITAVHSFEYDVLVPA